MMTPARNPPRDSTPQEQADGDRGEHRDQGKRNQLPLRRRGAQAHRLARSRASPCLPGGRDAELPPHLLHDETRGRAATELTVREENSHGMVPPIEHSDEDGRNRDTMPVIAMRSCRGTPSTFCTSETSVRNEPNRDTAAMTAEPMATPLVMALVVLPTASRSAMIWRAFGVQPRHFPDSVRVVRDGTEGVHGDVVARQGEHPDTGHGHAVQDVGDVLAPVDDDRRKDGEPDHDGLPEGGLEPDHETAKDDRGRSRPGSGGDVLHRLVMRVGEVLCQLVQRDCQHDTDADREERAEFVHVEDGKEQERHQGDCRGGVEAPVDGGQRVVALARPSPRAPGRSR